MLGILAVLTEYDFGQPERVLVVLSIVAIVLPSFAQITVATGSITGTVSDSTGAVVSGAGITITNLATGFEVDVGTNPSGAFNSGALFRKEQELVQAVAHQKSDDILYGGR